MSSLLNTDAGSFDPTPITDLAIPLSQNSYSNNADNSDSTNPDSDSMSDASFTMIDADSDEDEDSSSANKLNITTGLTEKSKLKIAKSKAKANEAAFWAKVEDEVDNYDASNIGTSLNSSSSPSANVLRQRQRQQGELRKTLLEQSDSDKEDSSDEIPDEPAIGFGFTKRERDRKRDLGFHYDYMQAISTMIVWCLILYLMYMFSGHHELLIRLTMPIFVLFTVCFGIIIGLYYYEIGKDHDRMIAEARFQKGIDELLEDDGKSVRKERRERRRKRKEKSSGRGVGLIMSE